MTKFDREILLVEDNPDDEELTLRALRTNHLVNSIQVVRDGQAALDYLFCQGEFTQRNPKDLPQLVLLDLKLPKVDGLDVLKRMREVALTKLIPVVVLTSSREEQDVVKGYSLGCNSYVCKPVDFHKFTEAVRQLSLYWLVLNEAPPK